MHSLFFRDNYFYCCRFYWVSYGRSLVHPLFDTYDQTSLFLAAFPFFLIPMTLVLAHTIYNFWMFPNAECFSITLRLLIHFRFNRCVSVHMYICMGAAKKRVRYVYMCARLFVHSDWWCVYVYVCFLRIDCCIKLREPHIFECIDGM